MDNRETMETPETAEGLETFTVVQKLEDLLLVSVPRDLTDSDVLRLRRQVLHDIRRFDSRWVLLDFSLVDICDSFFGRFIHSTARMAQLMGAEVIVSGLQDAVVETMVELGMALSNVHAVLDLDDALALSRETQRTAEAIVGDSGGPSDPARGAGAPSEFESADWDALGGDLLFADLEHFSESFWRSKELGERRFNFFLTLVTAVMAGVVAAHTSKEFAEKELQALQGYACAALLLVGLGTFLRMLQRNRVSDEYKTTVRYIRRLIAAQLRPRVPEYDVPHFPRGSHAPPRLLKGGLAELVRNL